MLSKKSKFILTIALVLVLCLSLCFVACDKTPDNTDNDLKEVVLIVGNAVINATTEAQYVHDLLVELNANGDIQYEFENGAYGATVLKLNQLETTNDWSKWIAVYHDIDDVTLYTPGYNYTLNGDEYYSSSVGVSSLPVIDGATYVFVQQ